MHGSRRSPRLGRRRSLTTIVALVAGLSVGFADRCAPPFADSALETYELEVIPDLMRVNPVLERPEEPFVMANLLAYKDMATGEGFEGLTGFEAYQLYIDGLRDVQAAIGSRLIWAGSVRSQIVGSSEPVFDSFALLEYASPLSFLGFALNPGQAPEARTAGLLGQWLVASTTLEEPEVPPPPTPPEADWTHFAVATGLCAEDRQDTFRIASGLSREQLCRLLEGPVDEPVFIVELLRFADGSGALYQPYREAIASVTEENGGQLVWRGSLDVQVLGSASPSFDEMVVTRYPSPGTYLRVLASPAVVAASPARAGGLELHWIYTADDVTDELGS